MTAVPKPERIRDEQYKAWIRRQPCLCGCGSTKNHAHHHGRPGELPRSNDFRTVPVDSRIHGLMKAPGWSEKRVAQEYGIDFEKEIDRLKMAYLKGIAAGTIERKRPKTRGLVLNADIIAAAAALPAAIGRSTFRTGNLKRTVTENLDGSVSGTIGPGMKYKRRVRTKKTRRGPC